MTDFFGLARVFELAISFLKRFETNSPEIHGELKALTSRVDVLVANQQQNSQALADIQAILETRLSDQRKVDEIAAVITDITDHLRDSGLRLQTAVAQISTGD